MLSWVENWKCFLVWNKWRAGCWEEGNKGQWCTVYLHIGLQFDLHHVVLLGILNSDGLQLILMIFHSLAPRLNILNLMTQHKKVLQLSTANPYWRRQASLNKSWCINCVSNIDPLWEWMMEPELLSLSRHPITLVNTQLINTPASLSPCQCS